MEILIVGWFLFGVLVNMITYKIAAQAVFSSVWMPGPIVYMTWIAWQGSNLLIYMVIPVIVLAVIGSAAVYLTVNMLILLTFIAAISLRNAIRAHKKRRIDYISWQLEYAIVRGYF